MKITPETLQQQGWTETTDPRLPWRSWSKEFGKFFLDLDNVSNMSTRGWSLHVDNWCRDTVASLDVDTFEHIEGAPEAPGGLSRLKALCMLEQL